MDAIRPHGTSELAEGELHLQIRNLKKLNSAQWHLLIGITSYGIFVLALYIAMLVSVLKSMTIPNYFKIFGLIALGVFLVLMLVFLITANRNKQQ